MKREQAHRLWAPPGAAFTPWVKPVLLAHLDEDRETEAPPSPPAWIEPRLITPLLTAAPPGGREGQAYRTSARLRDVALVLDLPGAEGVRAGVALVKYGFRPVPLYNAIPGPDGIVKLGAVMDALQDGAASLTGLRDDAPPAFLLDDRRMGKGATLTPGAWDNRSLCFPTDFPSSKTLRDAGIRRAVLVRRDVDRPAPDLARILRSWKEDGIEILLRRADLDGPVEALATAGPAWFAAIGHFFDRLSLRRRPDGTFGGQVPVRSSGS